MRMKRNKKILSIFVLLIVLAFIASFFSMVAFSNKSEKEEQQTQEEQQIQEIVEQVVDEIEEPSDFIKSVQASMVVSDDEKDTAQNLVNTLNIYNVLEEQNKIISFDGSKDDFSSVKQGLKDMDIYFEDIESSYEKSIWAMVIVDEKGIATLN